MSAELLDKIVTDEETVMTRKFIRAFRVCGCNPRCHHCGDFILAGMKFKLALVKCVQYYAGYSIKDSEDKTGDNDEMLCDKCTPEDLLSLRKREWKRSRDRTLHTGYTRQSKK